MSVLHRPAVVASYKLSIMLPLLPHIANSKAIISYKIDFFEYFETLEAIGDEDKSNQLSVPSGTVTDILVRVIEPLSIKMKPYNNMSEHVDLSTPYKSRVLQTLYLVLYRRPHQK